MATRLERAARWADNTQLYDAYDPSVAVFKAQISSYIDNQMDGAISKRRVISYAPNSTLPSRRAVTYQGERWLVGDELQDMHPRTGTPIRVSAATKKVTGLYRLASAAQLFTGGVQAYGQLVFLKDVNDQLVTSAYSPQFQVFFAPNEPAIAGYVIEAEDGRFIHIRSSYPVLDGFICTESDDLGYDARQTIILTNPGTTYDVVEDTWGGTPQSLDVLEVDYFKLYGKDNALVVGMLPGDLTLISPVEAKVGATVSLRGQLWTVKGGRAAPGGGWLAHVRQQ